MRKSQKKKRNPQKKINKCPEKKTDVYLVAGNKLNVACFPRGDL